MTETITGRNEPDSLSGTYKTEGVVNTIDNRFVALDEQRTKWVMVSDFQFSGFMRLLAPFMKGSMRRRTEEDMRRFKDVAESGSMSGG